MGSQAGPEGAKNGDVAKRDVGCNSYQRLIPHYTVPDCLQEPSSTLPLFPSTASLLPRPIACRQPVLPISNTRLCLRIHPTVHMKVCVAPKIFQSMHKLQGSTSSCMTAKPCVPKFWCPAGVCNTS